MSNLEKFSKLNCSSNYNLTQIIYPANPEKITELSIDDNNLSTSDLSIFSQFRNLKELRVGNTDKNKINQGIYNRWVGSLEPLKDLGKLKKLYIENTDISNGWEYLPDSLEWISYNAELRPDCKLAPSKEELEQELWKDIHKDFAPKYKKEWLKVGFNKEQTKEFFAKWNQLGIAPKEGVFINWFLNFKKLDLPWTLENEEEFKDLRDKHQYFGTCAECKRPNTSGGEYSNSWCQSCNAKHFQQDFDKWTSGNKNIDKFIQQCQLEATSTWNLLEWIPYEQFSNIEHIANGGFGKVEKAEWEGGLIREWNYNEGKWKRNSYDNTVALKTLTNSQNLNQELLTELTLYKMFRSEVSNMVPCYGISQDPEGNYVMVMKYMERGNLRSYLKGDYRKLGPDVLSILNIASFTY